MHVVPISEGPKHRFLGVGNVIVARYVGAPDARALADRVPFIDAALRTYPGVGQIVVVDRDASGSLPDRAFREASRAQADRYRGSILFSASVIEGEGVHHALVRTFLRSLALVAGKDVPVRFFERVALATEWAESLARPHGGPRAKDLAAVIEAARLRPALVSQSA